MEERRFKIKTPIGYLMVEAKGTEEEYPGVYVSFSKDGEKYDVSQMVACVEFINGEDQIRTETYVKNREDPVDIREWENGYDYYDLCFWDGVHDAVESDVNEVTIDL